MHTNGGFLVKIMSIFISGSVAYDTILEADCSFCDHATTLNLKGFNLTFQAPKMKRHFGGCAANIAYSLKACGGEPFISTAIGLIDCQPYYQHLRQAGIRVDGIITVENEYTPQAFITTDNHGNQLATFHEGAMSKADKAYVSAQEVFTHGIITSTAPHVMKAHTSLLKCRNVPVVWDVGPSAGYLSTDDIIWMLSRTDYLTVSEAEWALILEKSKLNPKELADQFKAIIITKAEKGCDLILDGQTTHFDALAVENLVNPVGCGDAFRGGLLRGLSLNLEWRQTIQLALLMGNIKAKHDAPQSYQLNKKEVAHLYECAYGETIAL